MENLFCLFIQNINYFLCINPKLSTSFLTIINIKNNFFRLIFYFIIQNLKIYIVNFIINNHYLFYFIYQINLDFIAKNLKFIGYGKS